MVFKLEGAQDDTQAGKPFKLEGAQDAEPSFGQRVKEDFSKRASGDIGKKLASGEISAPSAALQTVEAGGGFVGDVAGEAIKSAIPDAVKKPVVDWAGKVRNVVEASGKTLPGQQEISSKAKQAKQAWEVFSKKHPEAAADIGGLPNLLNLVPAAKVASSVGGIAATAGEKLAPSLAKAGETAIKSGAKDIADRKAQSFVDLISPRETKKVAEANVGKTVEKGLLRQQEVVPDKFMQDTAHTVSQVPGINPNRSFQYNYNKIAAENKAEAVKLRSALEAANVTIPLEKIGQATEKVKKDLSKQTFLVGDAKRVSDKMLIEAGNLLQKNGSTAAGLLKTRQEFDAWAKGQMSGDPFSDSNKARGASLKAVRDSLNNLIIDAVPDAKVKQSLTKQFHLYNALDNIKSKAAREGKNVISRGLQRAEDIIPTSHPFLRHTLGAPLGLAASVPRGLYKAGKYAAPRVKQGIGKGLTAMSDILAGPVKKEPQKLLTKAAPDVYTVDRQNVAKPITNAERQAAEASRTKATATGLTPDVRASQIRNEVNKAYEQRNLARNAVKEEQIAKIAQQSVVPVAQLVEMSDKNIKELSDILGKEHSYTAFAQALRKAIREKK